MNKAYFVAFHFILLFSHALYAQTTKGTFEENRKDEIVEYNRYLLDVQEKIIEAKENKKILSKDLEGISQTLDNYERILDSIRLHVRSQEVLLKNKKGELKVLENEMNEYREKAMALSKQLEETQEKHDSLNSIINQLQSSYNRTEQQILLKDERATELGREATVLNSKVTDLRNLNIEKGKLIQTEKEKLSKATNELVLQQDKLKYEQEKIDRVEEKLEKKYQNKQDIALQIKSLEAEQEEKKSKISSNKASITSWQKEIATTKTQIDAQSKKQNNPDLSSDEYKAISEKLVSLRELESSRNKELHQLEQENLKLETELDQNVEKIKLLHQDSKDNEVEIAALKEEKTAAQANMDAQQVQVNDLTEKKSRSELEISHLEEQIAKNNTEIDELNTELQNLLANKEAFDAEVVTLQKDKEEYKALIEEDKGAVQQEAENMDKLRTEIAVMNEKLKTTEEAYFDKKAEISGFANKIDEEKIELEANQLKVNRVAAKNDSIQKYTRTGNPTVDSLVLTGIELALEVQKDTAMYYFNEAVKIDSKASNARFLKAYTLFIHAKNTQALAETNKLIETDPRYINAFKLRAKIYSYQNKHLYAVKDYDHIVYLNKNDAEAYLQRGNMYYFDLNQYQKACEDWNTALALGAAKANIQIAEHCNLADKTAYEVNALSKVATEKDYGYQPSNPIKVGKDENGRDSNIDAYFKLLRSPTGKKLTFHRTGSCCPYPSENGINGKALLYKYQIDYDGRSGKKDPIYLYITYYDYETPKVPVGFQTEHEIY